MPLTILHLDDHYVFSRGVEKVLATHFHEVNYIHFTTPEDILEHITDAFKTGTEVSIIITDFNHPGLNGYEFAKQVKMISNTPILMLSMVPEHDPRIQQGLNEKIFDYYLPKSAACEEITFVIDLAIKCSSTGSL